MSDFDDQMAEWRKTVLGTGPCLHSSQENFTLTDEEREAVERAVGFCECTTSPLPTSRQIATIRGLLDRTK